MCSKKQLGGKKKENIYKSFVLRIGCGGAASCAFERLIEKYQRLGLTLNNFLSLSLSFLFINDNEYSKCWNLNITFHLNEKVLGSYNL